MKKLLFLFTTLLLISCSSEDDNETSETKTFLEKNDGLGFYDGDEFYTFFYNDDVFLKEVDSEDVGESFCVEYREGTNNVNGLTFNVEILTNDSERLIVKFINNSGEKSTTEYIVDSTQNELTIEYDNDGDPLTYFKTTTTYSSLCN